MRSAGSVCESCLIWIATSALITAASTAIIASAVNSAVPGRTITSTPTKPSTTAVQRRARTRSLSIAAAARVTNSGVEYDSDTACASGRWPMAQKPASIEQMPITQRNR